jgi:uncharacterized protein
MKTSLLKTIGCFVVPLLVAATAFAQFSKHSLTIKLDSFYSKILKEKRMLWVHVPKSPPPPKGYPVIYVLDGDAQTFFVLDALESNAARDAKFAGFLVIGLGNIWTRERDYTPTSLASSPHMDAAALSNSGGSKGFIAFMEKELLPYVAANYKAGNRRTLAGHSLGGLLVVEVLLQHTALFNAYIAIDPSLWWDNNKLLNQARAVLAQKKFQQTSFYLGVSNAMGTNEDFEKLKQRRGGKYDLVWPGYLLTTYLDSNRTNNLRYQWKYYSRNKHEDVFKPAITEALPFIYQ